MTHSPAISLVFDAHTAAPVDKNSLDMFEQQRGERFVDARIMALRLALCCHDIGGRL